MPAPQPAEPARRNSCQTLPVPKIREALQFSATYSPGQFARVRLGLVPGAMEDKWFIFYEDGWLYFHRSWTGACIYGVRFESTSEGAHVTDSWVTRVNSPKYPLDYDRALVRFLIDALLLEKQVPFPVLPEAFQGFVVGALPFNIVGRSYPEVKHGDENPHPVPSCWERIKGWVRF